VKELSTESASGKYKKKHKGSGALQAREKRESGGRQRLLLFPLAFFVRSFVSCAAAQTQK
jgi:hypothetical protein